VDISSIDGQLSRLQDLKSKASARQQQLKSFMFYMDKLSELKPHDLVGRDKREISKCLSLLMMIMDESTSFSMWIEDQWLCYERPATEDDVVSLLDNMISYLKDKYEVGN
jgi:hypothetical protein